MLDGLVALHTADDVGELHRRLLCFAHGGGNKADAFEPWYLLRQFHKDDPEGAVVTAMLLLTDRRWCNATGRLIRRIGLFGFQRGVMVASSAQLGRPA